MYQAVEGDGPGLGPRLLRGADGDRLQQVHGQAHDVISRIDSFDLLYVQKALPMFVHLVDT